MTLVVRNVTFMSRDPQRLADFWSAVVGYTQRHETEDEILLAPDDWGFPRFTFQRAEEPRSHPGPVHLDLTADDMAAEVERLVGLGAVKRWTVDVAESGTTTWTVMLDPDGNDFCVVQRPASE
jgi:predicted enzyme related to lactoylglutathione lyase